eukprot:TRINITY_DN1059_c0_g3_i1.p1 TRINITY_DN1059_c0_g3~~TRINITY_DN1059_c0_g3_i1.p1  ORF type:complete len:2924 (+),score=934.19 TRINITY_DN1059_c0_g3_i1:108-8879(+)
MSKTPVQIISGLSQAPKKAWNVGVTDRTTAKDILAGICKSLKLSVADVGMFASAGNKDTLLPDTTKLLPMYQGWKAKGSNAKLIVKLRSEASGSTSAPSSPAGARPPVARRPAVPPKGRTGSVSGGGVSAEAVQKAHGQLETVETQLKGVGEKLVQFTAAKKQVDAKLAQARKLGDKVSAAQMSQLLAKEKQVNEGLKKLKDQEAKLLANKQQLKQRIEGGQDSSSNLATLPMFRGSDSAAQSLKFDTHVVQNIEALFQRLPKSVSAGSSAFEMLHALVGPQSEPSLQEHALRIVLNSCTSESTQKYLLKTAITPCLVALLDPSNSENILKLTTWLFANLSSEAENSRSIAHARGVPPLVSLLESENDEIVAHCCECFRNMFKHDPLYREVFRQTGGVLFLLDMVIHGERNRPQLALEAFDILGYNREDITLVLESEAVPVLTKLLLDRHCLVPTKVIALKCLEGMALSFPERAREQYRDAKVVDAVFTLCSNEKFRAPALSIMSALREDAAMFDNFVSLGGIDVIVSALKDGENEKKLCLDLVDTLSKNDEQKSMFQKKSGVRNLAELLSDSKEFMARAIEYLSRFEITSDDLEYMVKFHYVRKFLVFFASADSDEVLAHALSLFKRIIGPDAAKVEAIRAGVSQRLIQILKEKDTKECDLALAGLEVYTMHDGTHPSLLAADGLEAIGDFLRSNSNDTVLLAMNTLRNLCETHSSRQKVAVSSVLGYILDVVKGTRLENVRLGGLSILLTLAKSEFTRNAVAQKPSLFGVLYAALKSSEHPETTATCLKLLVEVSVDPQCHPLLYKTGIIVELLGIISRMDFPPIVLSSAEILLRSITKPGDRKYVREQKGILIAVDALEQITKKIKVGAVQWVGVGLVLVKLVGNLANSASNALFIRGETKAFEIFCKLRDTGELQLQNASQAAFKELSFPCYTGSQPVEGEVACNPTMRKLVEAGRKAFRKVQAEIEGQRPLSRNVQVDGLLQLPYDVSTPSAVAAALLVSTEMLYNTAYAMVESIMKTLVRLNRKSAGMISSADIQKMFSNVPTILAFLERFLENMRRCVHDFDEENSRLGEYCSLAVGMTDFERNMIHNFNAMDLALNTFKDCSGVDAFLKFFEKERSKNPRLVPIDVMVLMPMAYSCQSFALFRRLLEMTPSTHCDFAGRKSIVRQLECLVTIARVPSRHVISQIEDKYWNLSSLVSLPHFLLLDSLCEVLPNKAVDVVMGSAISIMTTNGSVVDFIEHAVRKEIDATVQESTLFRGASAATKCMSLFAKEVGKNYLDSSIGHLLTWIATQQLDLEVDPSKLPAGQTVEANMRNLKAVCQRVINHVNGTIAHCPIAIRRVCQIVHDVVGSKFPSSALTSVGGLFFLRFVCPTFLAPQNYVAEELLTPDIKRHYILVSKVVQNLSNNIMFGKKEPFMEPMNDFIAENRNKMIRMQKRLATVPTSLKLREREIKESQYVDLYRHISEKFQDLEFQLKQEMKNVGSDCPILYALEYVRLELGALKAEGGTPRTPRESSTPRTPRGGAEDDKKAKKVKERSDTVSLGAPVVKKSTSYVPLQELFRNVGPRMMALLQNVMKVDTFASMIPSLVRLFTAQGTFDELLMQNLREDIDQAKNAKDLFASCTSLSVQLIQHMSRTIGFKYLRSSVVNFVREIIDCPLEVEVEPALLGPVSDDKAKENASNLVYLIQQVFAVLGRSIKNMPMKMRSMFANMCAMVDKKFPGQGKSVVSIFLHSQVLFTYVLDPVRAKLFPPTFQLSAEQKRNLSVVCGVIDNVIRRVPFGEGALASVQAALGNTLDASRAALEAEIVNAPLEVGYSSSMQKKLSDVDCGIIHYLIEQHIGAILSSTTDEGDDDLNEFPIRDTLEAMMLELGPSFRPVVPLSSVLDLELEMADREQEYEESFGRLFQLYWLTARPDLILVNAFGEVYTDYRFISPLSIQYASSGILERACKDLLQAEVAETKHASTLFRTESVATKFMSSHMHLYGDNYLKTHVRPLLLEVLKDGLEYEAPLTSAQDQQDTAIHNLSMRCSRIFDALEASAKDIPMELRRLFKTMFETVSVSYPEDGLRSVGGLFFLRLVCPIFVTPERWDILSQGSVNNVQRRKIILVSKVFQLLSNHLEFGKKEQFLIPMNEKFMTPNMERMKKFQAALCDIDTRGPETIASGKMDPSICAGILELLTDRADAVATEYRKLVDQIKPSYPLVDTVRSLVGNDEGSGGTDYTPLVEMMTRPDYCFVESIYEVTPNKEMETLLRSVLRIMFSRNVIVDFVRTTLADEIDRTIQESTLFRTNSLATYALSGFAQVVGGEYLRAVVKPVLDDIANCPLDFEVNPSKLDPDVPQDVVDNNMTNLIRACNRAFEAIASSLDFCPITIRQGCNFLFTLVGNKFPESALKSVGGFFFLRFVCPCFVTPERYGLIANATDYDADQRRKMILVSKVLQNMSNHLMFGAKEPFMGPLNQLFMEKMIPVMKDLQEKLAVVDENQDFQLEQPLEQEDCVHIHRIVAAKSSDIEKELGEISGKKDLKYPIRDVYLALVKKLGAPPPVPEELSAEEVPIAGRQRQGTKTMKRRLISMRSRTRSKLEMLKSMLNFKELQWLLNQPDYSLPAALFEVTPNPKMKELVDTLMSYYNAQGLLEAMVSHELQAEINRTVQESTLFRTDSLATFLIAGIARTRGSEYLQRVIKPLILEICNDGLNYEVNPAKLASVDEVEQNTANLVSSCEKVFNTISSSLDAECPMILRRICYFLSTYVGEKFPDSRQKSVGGYFFLRFACPPFVTPERFGLLEATEIDTTQRRKIILVSKVIQNLSNHLEFGKKEPFMEPINTLFIRKQMDQMKALQNKLADVQPLPVPVIAASSACDNECDDLWTRIDQHETEILAVLKQRQTSEEVDYDLVHGFEKVARKLHEEADGPKSAR